jgi:hypothetical protein
LAANSLILGNHGVPNPLTASQPSFAGNPVVPQPIADPFTTSINPLYPTLYNQGFRNPMGGFPFAIRSSFTKLKIEATVGVLALVPSRGIRLPFQIVE